MSQLGSQSLTSCIVMTCSLCLHFFGYECARAASITMLAAKNAGFGNEAIPLTIALGTPISGLVLYFYTKSIQSYGSRITLRISNISCLVIFILLTYFSSDGMNGLFGKSIIVTFYAFREIYVSLLSTQQWAFIATSLDKSTSTYIVTFSGIVSVASALGGFTVEQLVKIGGVKTLLISSCLCVLSCCIMGDLAFHFRPTNQLPTSGAAVIGHVAVETADTVSKSASKTDESLDHFDEAPLYEAPLSQKPEMKKKSFIRDSWNLVRKHPVLQILLVEGIMHQLCTNMLNLMFHNGLRKEVAEDSVRAMLVGRFFATVNIVVCILQIFVLPNILSQATLPRVLTKIPMIVMFAAALGVVRPGIISVMLGFGVIKVLEYSVMTAASEMIYVDMGHEVRYLGKELIRYFGHKMGKSAASLVLSGLVAHFNPSLATQSMWGAGLALSWGYTMYQLANHLWERNRNEEGFSLFKTAAIVDQAENNNYEGQSKSVSAAQPAEVLSEQRNSVDDIVEKIPAVWDSTPRSRNTSRDRGYSHSVGSHHTNTGRYGSHSKERSTSLSDGIAATGRRLAKESNELSFAASILRDDVASNSRKLDLDNEDSDTDSALRHDRRRTSSWDSQLSLSSTEQNSQEGSPLAIDRDSYRVDENEDEISGSGYGYEADAAWRKMYGGEEDDENVAVEETSDEHYSRSHERSRDKTRRRHTVTASDVKSVDQMHTRTLSHESKLRRENSISNRAKTMSFDGELENSRPIMLRVGSMHVSLNTLEQAHIARAKSKKR